VAQKKSYNRYFIILQEDETGYSLASDKLPSGYTKLETKNDRCKISYYVQNLKKDKEPYYMVLICNKKDTKKLIRLGVLNIDDYGRAEVVYEFDAENIFDSKISVDLIGGAAITRSEGSKLISVMSGFTSTEPPTDWRNYSLFEDRTREVKAESLEEKVKEAAQEEILEEREEAKQPIVENEEKNIFDEYEEEIEAVKQVEETRVEKVPDKLEEIDCEEEIVEEPIEKPIEKREEKNNETKEESEQSEQSDKKDEFETDKAFEDQYRSKHHEHKENKKNHYGAGTVGEYFENVVENLEEMKNVCTEIKNCKWHKVPAKCINDMCNASNYNKYNTVYYPMISYYPYINKREHYLLGYKYDSEGNIKYLIYAIPGTKKRSDQPYEGRSGFVTWVASKAGEEREDSEGYWLLFYDFRTSTVVIPIK
jgi:hypothetical protein